MEHPLHVSFYFQQIANTGKLSFFQESVSVNAEAERLVREEGVYTIIVLSHSGYDVDKIIAQNASERISLIVGGHSHTFLYTGGKNNNITIESLERIFQIEGQTKSFFLRFC